MARSEQTNIIINGMESRGGSATYTIKGGYFQGGTIYVGVTPSPTSTEYRTTEGTKVYIRCVPNDGYTFVEWSVKDYSGMDGDEKWTHAQNQPSGGYVYMPPSNITIDADFGEIIGNHSVVCENTNPEMGMVYVTTSRSEATSGNFTGTTLTNVSYGTTVTVRCTVNREYKLIKWYVTGLDEPFERTSKTGSFRMGNNNVKVIGVFSNLWVKDGDYWKLNGYDCVGDDGREDGECIFYKKIEIEQGCTGTIVLESSTEYDYDGIFLSKTFPVNWDGNFKKCNILYNSSSYATGCEDDNEEWTTTITNIPSGVYYISYRRDANERVTGDWVRYKLIQDNSGIWYDSDGYRCFDSINTNKKFLSYEEITIPQGLIGNITLLSSLSNNAFIFLSARNSIPTLNSYTKYFDGAFAEGIDGKLEISNIPYGTYYIGYIQEEGYDYEVGNGVKYKFTRLGDAYDVTFYANGGVLKDTNLFNWGPEYINKDVSKKKVMYYSSDIKNIGVAKKNGYDFLGWFTQTYNGSKIYDESGKFLMGMCFNSGGEWIYKNNINLYAQWKPIEYQIEYLSNSSVVTGNMDSSKHTYGVLSHISPIKYIRYGYEFLGWSQNPNDKSPEFTDNEVIDGTKFTIENNTVVLYAIWKIFIEEDPEDVVLVNNYNKMSSYGVKTSINNGNVYFIKDDKSPDYKIKIVDPDSIQTLDIFSIVPVIEGNKNIINTVDIDRKNDTNDLGIKIINRYSGYYTPIFKDILFYNNTKEKPFSNTSFDDDYADGYGKFGIINNLWFHKINDEKNNIIGTENTRYPLTGEYALDFRDYNIFSSTWDKNYYTKQMDINHNEVCDYMASMKEGLCMFGSKYLNVPNEIELQCFDNGGYSGEWNDEWKRNQNGCQVDVMFKEVNDNSVDFYFFIHKRLIRYFCEKLKPEFEKYINPKYSYGIKDSIDDDIEEYVTKNILKLYELKKIRVFVRRTKKGVNNSRIENEYGKYLNYTVDELKKVGFKEINNVSVSKKDIDDFDRQLTYNLRNGEQEDFGFSVLINKI